MPLSEPSSLPRCSAPRRSFSPICNPAKTSQPRSPEFAAFGRERSFGFRSTAGSFTYSMKEGFLFFLCGPGAKIISTPEPGLPASFRSATSPINQSFQSIRTCAVICIGRQKILDSKCGILGRAARHEIIQAPICWGDIGKRGKAESPGSGGASPYLRRRFNPFSLAVLNSVARSSYYRKG